MRVWKTAFNGCVDRNRDKKIGYIKREFRGVIFMVAWNQYTHRYYAKIDFGGSKIVAVKTAYTNRAVDGEWLVEPTEMTSMKAKLVLDPWG